MSAHRSKPGFGSMWRWMHGTVPDERPQTLYDQLRDLPGAEIRQYVDDLDAAVTFAEPESVARLLLACTPPSGCRHRLPDRVASRGRPGHGTAAPPRVSPAGTTGHHQHQLRSCPVPAAVDEDRTHVTTLQPPLLDRYFDALVRSDPADATDLLMDLLESGASLSEVVQDIVGPAQQHVGELWERGEWSVAQEHAATAVTEAAVSALWVMTARRQLSDGPHVALACAEGEWHALAPRMASALAAEAGAHVTVLGPSMPADHLRRRLEVGDVDVLAVSCTVPVSLRGAAGCVSAAHAVGVPVVVGGRAFAGRPQRARAVGADALVEAPQRLCEPAPPVGDDVLLPEEALRLDTVTDTTVAELHDRVVAAYPGLAGLTRTAQDRTREDLRWIVRFTGAAVLTGDATVLDDFLGSLLRILRGRLPDDVVLGGAEVVADGVERWAPAGADLLRGAVHRAQGVVQADVAPG